MRGRLWGASMVGGVAAQLVLVEGLAAAGHDPRGDPLAEVVVGPAGHGRLGHGRVLEQGVLDLAGADACSRRS